MNHLPSVSIITTCKGRWHHLRESLPHMLGQDYAEFEVIVVDYDCPDETYDVLAATDHSRLRAVNVASPIAPWSLPHARNVGASFANGQVLAFVDCDNMPALNYLTAGVRAMQESHASLCVPVHAGGRFAGACLVAVDAFHAVRGYDEALTDYGWDDVDFYLRLESQGRPSFRMSPRCTIPGNLLSLIHHDDGDRMRFCVVTKEQSLANNAARMQDCSRAVNLAGYGLADDCLTRGPIYPPALRVLRRQHAWPAFKPDLSFNGHGWMGAGNQRLLGALLAEQQPRCVLEVGAWLGLSTRFVLDNSPAHVVSVDLWDHDIVGKAMLREAGLSNERPLYEQFIANQWDYRDRLTPIRAGTVDGIWLARDAGLEPDLIYIDAAHDRASFEADLAAAARCFPRATLSGDDWNWGGLDHYTIQPAVQALAAARSQKIEVDGECWAIVRESV